MFGGSETPHRHPPQSQVPPAKHRWAPQMCWDGHRQDPDKNEHQGGCREPPRVAGGQAVVARNCEQSYPVTQSATGTCAPGPCMALVTAAGSVSSHKDTDPAGFYSPQVPFAATSQTESGRVGVGAGGAKVHQGGSLVGVTGRGDGKVLEMMAVVHLQRCEWPPCPRQQGG